MKKSSQHVVPSKDGVWKVKKSGADKATKSFTNKQAATTFAKGVAKNQKTELYVHRKNGTIQEKRSYGNIAPKSNGKK
jgi:hypothetical protein